MQTEHAFPPIDCGQCDVPVTVSELRRVIAATTHILDHVEGTYAAPSWFSPRCGTCVNINDAIGHTSASSIRVNRWMMFVACEWLKRGYGTKMATRLFPVSGEAQYMKEAHAGRLWKNQRRIKFVQFVRHVAQCHTTYITNARKTNPPTTTKE